METKTLLTRIFNKIDRNNADISAYEDLFSLCLNEGLHTENKIMREKLGQYIRCGKGDLGRFFDLYKRSLLFDSVSDFDAYLQYLEINRPAKERFYLPRRRIMKKVVDALQELADDHLDELFLSMPPRVGKLLSDDTPILTTKGWKNHGDLVVGDYVFSPNGKPVKVIAVHPKAETTHTVTFTNGTAIDCHFRHEWQVFDRRFGKVRTLETQEMIGKLENGKKHGEHRGHRYNFQILQRAPLEGVPVDLKVKPYTFGAWLGDGHNIQPRVTGIDEEIIKAIEEDGYTIKHEYVHSLTGVKTTEFSGLQEGLNQYNMCFNRKRTDKYIPDDYLIAPMKDRLNLLAGLLDTDGCLRTKERRYDFTTSDEALKVSFTKLIATFGWRCSVTEHIPRKSSSGVEGKKTYWTISFNPDIYIPCRLIRKQLFAYSQPRRIAISSIEESKHKPGNCITVEGDGMYLAGYDMIPTHNTTILMFYLTWILGRDSELSNLYSAYSDVITKALYNGVLEIIEDPVTYLWHDVFPEARIVSTNSADETLNLDRRKRYPSLTARSLYGTLNGACDCRGMLISDDLISGIEEAMNKDRLVSAWAKVDNNLIPRARETAKILWCGTRWSMIDPIGVRLDLLENDPEYKTRRVANINLPALDADDESNFEYDYGVGFSTGYYRQRRASFERNNDTASWAAQYQGDPIEREGALFTPEGLRYYNGVLPEGEPDRVFMAVDPAFGGGDYVSGPIACQYGEDLYICDVVFDNGDKKVTQPLIADAIVRNGVQAAQFEATKATEAYKEGVEALLKQKKIRLNITTKAAPTDKAKYQRIFDCAPDIRDHMIFLESGKRSKAYSLFMQNVLSYKTLGKNKNDDGPDSLTMLWNMTRFAPKVEVFKRPF